MTTRIYVSRLSEGMCGPRVILGIRYGEKQANLEISPKAAYDREPAIDAYRRELLALLDALEEWEWAGEAIADRAP